MKIPLLSGVYADSAAAFRASYPVNLEPTLVDSGISKGYLTNAPGITLIGTGPGADRGGINWQGVCYRVMGSKLVSVTSGGAVTVLGDVGNNSLPVTLDYSFDRLAIASNGNLFYYQTSTGLVTQVTDPDLGTALDVLWIDGYFMTTDGKNLVVTDLNDPYSVDPLKYGSAEADPDPVVGLGKVRGEVYALNRYTIQNFQDVGGAGFPFANNASGLIPKGVVGTHAWAYFLETFAFVGSARNEALSIYLAGGGETVCVSTSDIDKDLAALTVAEQALIQVEARIEQGEQRLYVHLPTKSMVYMRQASQQSQQPIWHVLADGINASLPYSARHMTQVYGQWMVGDASGNIGVLDLAVETRFGVATGWQFDTVFLYNEGRGGIIKSLELAGLPGRAPGGTSPTCSLSITQDGATYGAAQSISMGTAGQFGQRVQWRPGVRFANYIGLRFTGSNTAMASWAALVADVEPLAA